MGNSIKGVIIMKIEIDLPDEFEEYFEYLQLNYGIKIQDYIKKIVKDEINSRNIDLKIF